jgi:hypothetical protein
MDASQSLDAIQLQASQQFYDYTKFFEAQCKMKITELQKIQNDRRELEKRYTERYETLSQEVIRLSAH